MKRKAFILLLTLTSDQLLYLLNTKGPQNYSSYFIIVNGYACKPDALFYIRASLIFLKMCDVNNNIRDNICSEFSQFLSRLSYSAVYDLLLSFSLISAFCLTQLRSTTAHIHYMIKSSVSKLDLRNSLSTFNLAWVIGVSFAKDQKSFEDCCCSQDLPYFLMRVERGWWQKVEGRHPKTVSSSNPNRLTQCGRRAVIEHILW